MLSALFAMTRNFWNLWVWHVRSDLVNLPLHGKFCNLCVQHLKSCQQWIYHYKDTNFKNHYYYLLDFTIGWRVELMSKVPGTWNIYYNGFIEFTTTNYRHCMSEILFLHKNCCSWNSIAFLKLPKNLIMHWSVWLTSLRKTSTITKNKIWKHRIHQHKVKAVIWDLGPYSLTF